MKHIKLFEAFFQKEAEEFMDFCKKNGYKSIKVNNFVWQYRIRSAEAHVEGWNEDTREWEEIDMFMDANIGECFREEMKNGEDIQGKDLMKKFPDLKFVDADEKPIGPDDYIEVEEGSDS